MRVEITNGDIVINAEELASLPMNCRASSARRYASPIDTSFFPATVT